MQNVYRVFEVKHGANWEETYRTDDRGKVYEDLAYELLNYKVFHYPAYARMTQTQNYNGTRTIVFYQTHGRSRYVIDA